MDQKFTFLLTIKERVTVFIGYWQTAHVTTMVIPPSHDLGPGVLYPLFNGLRHGLPLCFNRLFCIESIIFKLVLWKYINNTRQLIKHSQLNLVPLISIIKSTKLRWKKIRGKMLFWLILLSCLSNRSKYPTPLLQFSLSVPHFLLAGERAGGEQKIIIYRVTPAQFFFSMLT